MSATHEQLGDELRDLAPDILSEDLDWRGGYERVLTAMAGGARRRSRITSWFGSPRVLRAKSSEVTVDGRSG